MTNPQKPVVIRSIHTELEGAHRSPCVECELPLREFTVGKEQLEKLMLGDGIRACHKKHDKVTAGSKYGSPIAANLLTETSRRHAEPDLGAGHYVIVDR